ncbi:MFS transporter, partial [Streptomyces anulatus]
MLVLAQTMSGAGLTAGITVGALLAEEMLGSTGLAGVGRGGGASAGAPGGRGGGPARPPARGRPRARAGA